MSRKCCNWPKPHSEKNVDPDVVFDALEFALGTAAKKIRARAYGCSRGNRP